MVKFLPNASAFLHLEILIDDVAEQLVAFEKEKKKSSCKN